VAEHGDRVGDRDPARRRDHRQRVGGGLGQRGSQPPGRRERQLGHRSLGDRQAGRDLDGPERVPAGLGGREPRLRGGHRRRQQALDLPLIQRREADPPSSGYRGGQVTPAVQERRRGDGQRVGRGLGARGQQHAQRSGGDPPQRERQRLHAARVQPLDVVDRDQYRRGIQARPQGRQHGQVHRVGGGRLVPGGPQQQGDLECLALRPGDAVSHLGKHPGQRVRQSGEGRFGVGSRRLAAQHAAACFRRGRYPRLPQGGLAGARLTGDGEQGRHFSGTQARSELADSPPLSGAHQTGATGNHTLIPSHRSA
jgi:hypothetical protein